MKNYGWTIYLPFLAGALFCYAEYLWVKHGTEEKTVPLDAYHVASHEICRTACDNVKTQMCQEWIVVPSGQNLCPDICDTFLESEMKYGSGSASGIFSCVAKASSPAEIQRCGLTCTGLIEL